MGRTFVSSADPPRRAPHAALVPRHVTGPRADTLSSRLRRRLLTVPALLFGAAAYAAAFPLLFLGALVLDLFGKGLRLRPHARLAALILGFLSIDALGLSALFLVWLTTPFAPARWIDLTYRVQRRYVQAHFSSIRWIYDLEVAIEGEELLGTDTPLLVMTRHSSLLDVILPGYFLQHRQGIRLRYVLKQELLLEPCLDVAGHVLPNHFVARGGVDTAGAVASLRELKRSMPAGDAVLLYPEGTHFSEGKRASAIARLEGEPRARAEALRHLLPCRPAGSLALLEGEPPADVVFFGHHGFEGLSKLGSLRSGALVGRTLRLRFWREPASSIPSAPGPEGQAARAGWLAAHWQRMDDWLHTLG